MTTTHTIKKTVGSLEVKGVVRSDDNGCKVHVTVSSIRPDGSVVPTMEFSRRVGVIAANVAFAIATKDVGK